MAIISYNNVGITALAACVPGRVIDNYHYSLDIWPEEEVKKVVDKVGVFSRRFADEKTCASDLCYAAAERLIADNGIDRNEIEANAYIADPAYKTLAYKNIVCKEFNYEFSHNNDSIILMTVGFYFIFF